MADVKISGLPAATTPLAGTELFEVVQSGASKKVAASAIAATAANVRTVPTGGTGAATLTGYVKGNGTAAMTAAATIPVADISGIFPVANGGTGAGTLTGYVKGTGTTAMTASATVPFLDVAGRAYISAYDVNDQTGSTTAATAVRMATTSFGAGITIAPDGSANLTRITFAVAGTYMLAPSLQFKNTDTNEHDATIWFRKDGTNIANSASIMNIPRAADGGAALFQIVFYEQVTAGQYIEVMWLPENAAVTIDYIAAGAIAPAIPSVILAAERIA
jgi:hypothetical protein